MSAAANRRVPPDILDRVDESRQYIYLSGADEWARLQATSGGEIKASVSGSDVAIQGINSAGERATIFAEQIDDPVTASAVGVVTRGARALESLSADEWRAKQYAEDGAGNLHAVNAETLGSGITSGAAGVNTYADRALQSVGLDQRRVDLVSAGATVDVDQTSTVDVDQTSALELRGLDGEGTLLQVMAEHVGSAVDATDVMLLTAAAPALQGVAADMLRTRIQARRGQSRDLQVPAASISGGNAVSAALFNGPSFTVYLSAAGSATVDVEFSPDGNETFYGGAQIETTSAGEIVRRFNEDVDVVRLEATTSNEIRAQLRETL